MASRDLGDVPTIICDREGCYKPAVVEPVVGDYNTFHVKCHGEEQLLYVTSQLNGKLVWSNLSFIDQPHLANTSEGSFMSLVAHATKVRRYQHVLHTQGSQLGIKLTHKVRQEIQDAIDTLIWLSSVCVTVDE